MKIDIYTIQLKNALPPRIRLEKELLENAGYEVEVIGAPYPKFNMRALDKIKYYLTLSYFRWDLIQLYSQHVKTGDIAIVYDLSLLPLVKQIRHKYQRLVYETLDNNVALTFFHLKKQYPFLSPLESLIKKWVAHYEFTEVSRYTDHLIVNSVYLKEVFGAQDNCTVNIYASPFENFSKEQALGSGSEPALLYLGIFSEDKGASEVLRLQRELNIPLYIFGDKKYPIPASNNIFWTDRMPLDKLFSQLLHLSKKYRFTGISLIRSSNDSYANQEANKEADYLSLGIPFIGNMRRTTEEKINAGVGCFLHETNKIQKLVFDPIEYNVTSKNAILYYSTNLSIANFKIRLMKALALS